MQQPLMEPERLCSAETQNLQRRPKPIALALRLEEPIPEQWMPHPFHSLRMTELWAVAVKYSVHDPPIQDQTRESGELACAVMRPVRLSYWLQHRLAVPVVAYRPQSRLQYQL